MYRFIYICTFRQQLAESSTPALSSLSHRSPPKQDRIPPFKQFGSHKNFIPPPLGSVGRSTLTITNSFTSIHCHDPMVSSNQPNSFLSVTPIGHFALSRFPLANPYIVASLQSKHEQTKNKQTSNTKTAPIKYTSKSQEKNFPSTFKPLVTRPMHSSKPQTRGCAAQLLEHRWRPALCDEDHLSNATPTCPLASQGALPARALLSFVQLPRHRGWGGDNSDDRQVTRLSAPVCRG